jgi:hypothetical protein
MESGTPSRHTSGRVFEDVPAERPVTKINSNTALGVIGVLGFVVPGLAGVFLAPVWDFPGTQGTPSEIAAYVAEHQDALRVGVVLNAVGVTLWGVFGAGIWLRLRRITGGESLLSACFLAGVVSFVTLLLAGFTAFLVLAYRAPQISDPRLLYDISFGLLAMSGLPTALALGSYAALTFESRHLPLWTAWLAAVGAAAHVLLLASFLVSDGFLSLEGQVITAIPATLFLWNLGTGIALLRDSGGRVSSATGT